VTELSVAEVHQFFADQLAASGWVQLIERQTEDGQLTYWELYTEEGTTWAAVLEVSAKPEGSLEDYYVEVRAVLPP